MFSYLRKKISGVIQNIVNSLLESDDDAYIRGQNARLFAHIQNDACISGLYELNGNYFRITSVYLKEFLESLERSGEPFNPKYNDILREMNYAIEIEQVIKTITVDQIAERVAKDLEDLAQGAKLTLPGGWTHLGGGHAMIYQFIREADHYLLKVINSGWGLQYHGKKSIAEKELYNPIKAWSIPLLQTPKDKNELAHFIGRLLNARLSISVEMSGKKLYEEILPSISYIGGREISADKLTPDFAYTGGQLSGTCTQRSIHQMLKINSNSLEEYRRFIFKFKMHSLSEYADSCLKGSQPFNAPVASQIHLAIENNLKILNTPGLFDTEETVEFMEELCHIRERIETYPLVPTPKEAPEKYATFFVRSSPVVEKLPELTDNEYFAIAAPITIDFSVGDFLTKLSGYVTQIEQITDSATRYTYLEQLILALPLSSTNILSIPPYTSMKTLADYEKFSGAVRQIQVLLHELQTNWARDTHLTKLNTLVLNALKLRTDIYNVISQNKSLPSFKGCTDLVLNSIIGNQTRNPFWATNHPQLDARMILLQDRFKNTQDRPIIYLFSIFNELLSTEPQLKKQLTQLYMQRYGRDPDRLHLKIKSDHYEALYILSLHINESIELGQHFSPIIQKVQDLLDYDTDLRRFVNPMYQTQYHERPNLRIEMYDSKQGGRIELHTALCPVYLPRYPLSQKILEHKYDFASPSPAKDALDQDSSEKSVYVQVLNARTTNYIQLNPGKGKTPYRTITQDDIIARDYHHLRSNPNLQIALTLDYFTRNIDKLSDEAHQRYIEANLFQIGLLLDAIKQEEFIPQFDSFLDTGLRFFTKSGQHTRVTLQFLRLNVLVSSYMALDKHALGIARLTSIQDEILKQLQLATDPDIIYVLQQYLFLATIRKIESKAQASRDLELALNAYRYIQGHTNPSILEDSNHKADLETAVARFKTLMSQQRSHLDILIKKHLATADLNLEGSFPNYRLTNPHGTTVYTFNAILGKLFEGYLASSGIPLTIKNHPLLKRLELDHFTQCLMSADQSYMVLPNRPKNTEFFYKNHQLTIRQQWSIHGRIDTYELHAISLNHLARHANCLLTLASSNLPKTLQDGSIDYWQSTASPVMGLLVQNNRACYAVDREEITLLDDDGYKTDFKLKPLHKDWAYKLTRFESSAFMHHHESCSLSHVALPRFNLCFERSGTTLRHTETNEEVVNRPSPIDPQVAGMILTKDGHERYLIPIARFYATHIGAVISDFYPVVHDTDGTIARKSLEKLWRSKRPLHTPLWHHQNSAAFISLQLKDGKPITETAADAIYLAYIYLSTNQTQNAWDTLEDCKKRLGGLTGSAAELKYISWIVNSLPHILYDQEEKTKDAIRETPPYIACKLKALSLACDYLSHDKTFNLEDAPGPEDISANAQYKILELEASRNFLTELPKTIYQLFDRLQKMRRHLEGTYTLSTIERKRLLNYYQQSQAKEDAPKGALGFEWMQLNLEALQDERRALLALNATGSISDIDRQRLSEIDLHFRQLKPVLAQSTKLNLVPINLEIAQGQELNQEGYLLPATRTTLSEWIENLPGIQADAAKQEQALHALSSNINEDELITYFPVYLQIVQSADTAQKKALMDFCSKALIANRHIPIANQTSNLSFLCNILYRVQSHPPLYLGGSYSLNQLVYACRDIAVEPPRVYEAFDVYESILASPEALLQQTKPGIRPVKKPKSDYRLLIKDIAAGSALAELLESYHKLNQELEKETLIQTRRLKADPEQSVSIEEQAGASLLRFENQQRKIAGALSQDSDAQAQISELISLKIPEIKRLQENGWKHALALANQGPNDPEINQKWCIERLSKARPMLTTADLYSVYNYADLNFIIEKTGLSEENAQKLYDTIHHALIYGIQNKMLTNMQEGLAKDSLPAVLDLLAKTEIPALDEPAIILLQHEEEIVLRPRQVSALKHLLETPETAKPFRESVEKIIPGGGKSKVILPILAEKKARGDNLVIIEVPQALLATNHVDLNQMSQRLFSKEAYRFEFNRDSNSSSARLEQLFTQFTEIITTRGYLVTTGESIQSLELKYLELLLSEEDHNKEWEQQIFWCDKIVNLLHHRGDAVIDEVHQGLWIKKKLNYTLGNPKTILPSTIHNAIALFGYIDSDFIKKAPSLGKDFNWGAFKKTLATKLITEKNSPLYDFVKDARRQYGQEVTDYLIDYILNQAQTQCEAIRTASDETKSVLAFFKQEVSVLLPQTLGRRLDEKYGASKRANLNSIEQTLAIPYAANNIPNERSRFGNHLEAVNYTCQMMLLKGISKEIMIARISLWLSSAAQELFKNPQLKEINQTPTAQGFAMTWTEKFGLKFSEINLKDDDQMSALHTKLQHDRELIFDILESQSLKLINLETGIIHSDSFNHVDLYRTVQGISGTPSNHTTYHERLEYDQTTSLGTDGYIIQLLNYKDTPIAHIDYENATQFINRLFANSTKAEQCRAIIDISATFQGISNLQVAQQIAEYTKVKITKIKHILYFNNEDQVLCAISVHKPNATILLKSSDVDDVNRILSTTPDERFTYYDQARTSGTDITQDSYAHAFVLVDEKTSLQSFLQGSMRMRGISQNQTIELVTPTNLARVNLAELINKFNQTDESALLIDNLVAAKEMMTNLARRICLDWVQALPSENAEGKAQLAKQLKTFFISNPSNDLFALYGALSRKQSIKDILAHCQKQVLSLLKVAMRSASMNLTPEHEADISDKLQVIIDKALPNCPKEYEGSQYSLGVEVEVQKEVQKEEETQVMCINQQYEPKLVEAPCVHWRQVDIFGPDIHRVSWSLNAMCSPSKAPGAVTLFSPELRVSESYAQTHTTQTEWIDAFLKPVFTVWYHQDSTGNLTAMIITPQDAQGLQNRIKSSPGNWLTTTANTVLCGTRPIKMLANLQYQSLQEQIRFFNGEFDSFLKADAPMCWLNQKQDEKIRFFEERLLTFRPQSLAKFQELKTALNESNMEGYDYIVQHPFDDLTDYDWHSLNPNTSQLQIVNYKNLAKAFDYINHHWQDETITIHTLKEQFPIPLRSLGYLNTHLDYLKGMQSLINRHAIFLTGKRVSLLPNELIAIEKGLGMKLNDFYELNQQITQEYINQILLITTLVNCPVLQIPPQLNAILKNYAKNAPSSKVLIALIRRLSKLPLNLVDDAMDNSYCDENTITAILESNAPISEDILLKLALQCTTEEQRKLLTKYSSFNDKHLLSIIQDIHEETLSELLKQNHKAVTNSVLASIVSKDTYTEKLILETVSHPKASASTWTSALQTSTELLIATVQRWVSDSGICPQVLEKIMRNDAIDPHEVMVVSTIAKIACEKINHQSTESLWAFIALNALRRIPNAEMISLIENFNKKPIFALDVLKIFGREVINKLPIRDMIEAADNIQLEIIADRDLTENCLSSQELSLLFKHCSTEKQLDLLLRRKDLDPDHIEQILCKKGLSDEQLLLIIKLSSHNRSSDFNNFKKALNQLNTQAQDQWLKDIKHQQEEAQTAAKQSGDPALQLSAAIEKLRVKAITHTVKSIKNTLYDTVAKTAFELYQKLAAENEKPQINKQQFLQYITDAKPVLDVHKGYKQVLVDIFNALLILLGAVKYYVTGDWRFFKTNTDSINIVNEIINDLNHSSKTV